MKREISLCQFSAYIAGCDYDRFVIRKKESPSLSYYLEFKSISVSTNFNAIRLYNGDNDTGLFIRRIENIYVDDESSRINTYMVVSCDDDYVSRTEKKYEIVLRRNKS